METNSQKYNHKKIKLNLNKDKHIHMEKNILAANDSLKFLPEYGRAVERNGSVWVNRTGKYEPDEVYESTTGLSIVLTLRGYRGVHELVARAFLESAPPDHSVVCHRGDLTDNSIDNLYWCAGKRAEYEEKLYQTALNEFAQSPWSVNVSNNADVNVTIQMMGATDTKKSKSYSKKDIGSSLQYLKQYQTYVSEDYRFFRKASKNIFYNLTVNFDGKVKTLKDGWKSAAELYKMAFPSKDIHDVDAVRNVKTIQVEKTQNCKNIHTDKIPEGCKYREDFDVYVSKDGRVFRYKNGQICDVFERKGQVRLNRKDYSKRAFILETFTGNPNQSRYVIPLNGDKTDCRLENLEWDNANCRCYYDDAPSVIDKVENSMRELPDLGVLVTEEGIIYRRKEGKWTKQDWRVGNRKKALVGWTLADGRRKVFPIQVLVAMAFDPNYKEGCCTVFKDGNNRNFRRENIAVVERRWTMSYVELENGDSNGGKPVNQVDSTESPSVQDGSQGLVNTIVRFGRQFFRWMMLA